MVWPTAIGLMIAIHVAPAQAEQLVVSRASFAGGIANREPGPGIRRGTNAAPGPLWFWTEIQAGTEALQQLRREKRLPLQHRWYRYDGGAGPDEAPDFIRDLEEITEKKIEGLEQEARERLSSFFTYRTSSCRIDLKPGAWIVKVTDGVGAILSDANGQDARYEIVVRFGGYRVPTPCRAER